MNGIQKMILTSNSHFTFTKIGGSWVSTAVRLSLGSYDFSQIFMGWHVK